MVLLNSVSPTSSPATTGLFRYFTPTKPEPGKNGAPKMVGSKVQPRGPAEGVVVGITQGERHVHRRVVRWGIGHVHVGPEGGEQTGDCVSAVRDVDAEAGLVQRLEARAGLRHDVYHAGPDPGGGIDRRVARSGVVKGVDEVEDVLVAGGEVVAETALLHQDAERVLAAGPERRVAFRRHEPDVTLRGGDAALQQRIVQIGRGVALGHQSGLRPRGDVVRVRGVVDRLDLLPVVVATRAEQLAAGGVAGPLRIGVVPDDARHLDPGVEHVLVGGALGPETASDGGRVGGVDADLPVRLQAAVDPVDGERAHPPWRRAGSLSSRRAWAWLRRSREPGRPASAPPARVPERFSYAKSSASQPRGKEYGAAGRPRVSGTDRPPFDLKVRSSTRSRPASGAARQ